MFVQSEKAFGCLTEIDMNEDGYFEKVDCSVYYQKYNERDQKARFRVAELIDSDENTLRDTIDNYL